MVSISKIKAKPRRQAEHLQDFVVKALQFIKALNPLWFLLPALVLMCMWSYFPLIKTFYYSFTEWNLLPTSTPVGVGWRNYEILFSHPDFKAAVWNTLLYIAGMLPFSVILPLALAIITERMSDRARNIYRALFFLPMVMPPVATAVVWRWLLHPTNGIINRTLISLGIVESGINFLTNDSTAMLSVIAIAGWKMIGFSTLMFSAALTNIDKSYYEAANIDNVPRFRQTLTITLPLISPTVVYMIMLSILFSAQWTFVYINELTQGGPAGASTNIYYLMFVYGMRSFNVGLSSAAAVTFFILFGLIALILTRINRRIAFYDN